MAWFTGVASGNSVRTFNVVLGIRVWSFVVVDHLDHLEKVIFAESLEAVGQFIHIDLWSVSMDKNHRK